MGHTENDKPLTPRPDILPVPQRQLTAEESSSLHDFVMSHFKPCSHTPGCPLRSDVSPERRLAGEIREWAKSCALNMSEHSRNCLSDILDKTDGQGGL